MAEKKVLLCNAGMNAASVLPDGSVNVCYDRKTESLGNIFTGFQFRKNLTECDFVHCACPLWAFEKELHKLAKGEPCVERPYTAYLHWHITYECQMLCNYCIVTGPDRKTDTEDKLRKSKAVDMRAVKRTLDETGITFYISMMGGEPFLVPNITEVVRELTTKHYVGFNTNLAAIPDGFWESVNHERLGHFHISLHAQPMERRKLKDRFIENYQAMWNSGFRNFDITAVGSPNLLKRIDEYRDYYGQYGIQFKLIPMIEGGGATGGKPYPESYTPEELAIIDRDWLADYFPRKIVAEEKHDITKFRARGKDNPEHVMLDDVEGTGEGKGE